MKPIHSFNEYKKRNKQYRFFILLSQIGIGILFFAFWEVFARVGLLNDFLVSKPSSILSLFVHYMKNNLLVHHVWISTYETILGLIIGTGLGLIISTLLFMSKSMQKIIDPFLTMLNALPKTSLGPIIIIWLGTSSKGIIGVCVSLSLVMTIISSLSYFNAVDSNYIKMMKVFKANKFQILLKVIYPANIDNLLTLLKVNIGLSWVGTIVGEFLVSKEGIGYLVVYGGQVFKMDLVMMGVLILSVIALLMYESINLIQFIIKKHQEKQQNNLKNSNKVII